MGVWQLGCGGGGGTTGGGGGGQGGSGTTGTQASSTTGSGGAALAPAVTDITPDQAINPVYAGITPAGHLLLTEGQPQRVIDMEASGKIDSIDSTTFTGFEWPRSVAVDDAGRAYIAGYQSIWAFASGASGPIASYVDATAPNQTWDWIVWGGNPKRLWALTADSGTAPKIRFVRFDAATPQSGGVPTTVAEVDRFAVMSFVVDDSNNVFAVDSNQCRVRKVTPAGQVTILAGKPAAEGGSCAFGYMLKTGETIPRDSGGNVQLPQAIALGWDPTGKKLVLSGAGMLIDVTEQADGKSLGKVLLAFPMEVNNEHFATGPDALFVIDRAAKGIKKVVF
ncbi:MAG: hypothetical protein ABI193_01075 [Minicystis sp.]